MRNSTFLQRSSGQGLDIGSMLSTNGRKPRQLIIGIILVLALFAFEIFNFDTTRFALESLLGDIRFAGLAWATILAIAFCAIDFAGLSRLFTPERGLDEPKEVWYLTGAWLLGATMNAVMTWWAVSLVLLNHDLGNEVMSREQLLKIVPIFVAALVWLTRILFIGSLTVAGDRLLHPAANVHGSAGVPANQKNQSTSTQYKKNSNVAMANNYNSQNEPVNLGNPPIQNSQKPSRVRQRPPRPIPKRKPQVATNGIQASGKRDKSYRN